MIIGGYNDHYLSLKMLTRPVIFMQAGTLTFMVGAEEWETFLKAKEVLTDMGKIVYHCGAVGTGQSVKICNNMLLAISMIGVSETMNLGIW